MMNWRGCAVYPRLPQGFQATWKHDHQTWDQKENKTGKFVGTLVSFTAAFWDVTQRSPHTSCNAGGSVV